MSAEMVNEDNLSAEAACAAEATCALEDSHDLSSPPIKPHIIETLGEGAMSAPQAETVSVSSAAKERRDMAVPIVESMVEAPSLATHVGAADKPPSKMIRFARFAIDTWASEYICLGASVTCLSAMYVLLGAFDGRALDEWHSYFTINTILSGLSTAMKGCTTLATVAAIGQLKWAWFEKRAHQLADFAIYDEASRGFLGASRLLYHLCFWHLASMGCSVVMLSMVSDAFVQASVITTTRPSTKQGVASVQISSLNADNANDCLWGCGADQANQQPGYTVNDGIKATLYAGVFNGSAGTVTAHCPTGNCDFSQIATAGICSQCLPQAHKTAIRGGANGSYPHITATLSSKTSVSLEVEVLADNSLMAGAINITAVNTALNFADDSSGRMPLTTLDILVALPAIAFDAELGCSPPSFFSAEDVSSWFYGIQCNISLCAQVLRSEVAGGVLKETPVRRILTGEHSDDAVFRFDADATASPSQVLADDTTYTLLADYLAGNGDQVGVLGGNGYATLDCSLNEPYVWSSDIAQAIWDPIGLQSDSDVFGVVSSKFDSIAASLTQGMRAVTNKRVTGTATALEPYIHVRWPYMIVPSLMVLIATIFVPLTCWQSARRAIPTWKSDVLASIVHTNKWVEKRVLDSEDGTLDKLSGLEEWAEQATVRLRPPRAEKDVSHTA